jgi:hypothetical protein
MAAFDFDERTVRPAIIDIGILHDGNVNNDGTQCDVTYQPSQLLPANFDCDSTVNGEYNGILPDREKHGNNIKNLIAATVNDKVEDERRRAGIAGQGAIPNLYRFDEVHNYVFELYSTIDRAVADNSTVINISGGFPCRWRPPRRQFNDS